MVIHPFIEFNIASILDSQYDWKNAMASVLVKDTVDPNLVWNFPFDELTVDRELQVL